MFNKDRLFKFVSEEEYNNALEDCKKAKEVLYSGTGEGSDFLGWISWPVDYYKEEVDRMEKAAQMVRRNSDCLVVIGIGGSYLGAKALYEALRNEYEDNALEIIFAGNNMSSSALVELRDYLIDKDFSVNVVSKSGTTTEPAIAFRFLYDMLKKKYMKEELSSHIFFTTDKARGALHQIGVENGYEMFEIPDNIGGRFSVLTAVGLFPLACAGFEIRDLLKGAAKAMNELKNSSNAALEYAACRNALYKKGYSVEILSTYEKRLSFISQWWQQLFGESEGKDSKGIWPCACMYSTDLHSLGQYIQEGQRIMFETVLHLDNPLKDVDIPFDKDNLDGLNYLAHMSLDYVNKKAEEGVAQAHEDGGVPQLVVSLDEICEESLGYLIYFFELSCGISAYALGVNPFNQPGVEAYKTNMFRLLKKPGYTD